ncbi:MAG: sigma 54-interacting transcriptional regulator [Firmicutes bacterium]|nr:sigma 54-interacting transcriptional regulator [Bacillota bacterium]
MARRTATRHAGKPDAALAPMVARALELIMDSIDEGIHVVNCEGITVLYNRVAAALDNLKKEEVIGRPLLEVFPSLTVETSTLLRVLQTQEAVADQPQTYRNYKGHQITTSNSTMPIFDNGCLVGALEISRDVTRIRELSERVVDLQSRLISGPDRKGRGASIGAGVGGAVFTFDDIVGRNQGILELKRMAARAARSVSPVFVHGKTGTGKELLVQAIHNAGERRDRPFIAQNCAALPDSLLEGILFGTSKGGFTGAVDRPGLFELAHRGTLFLDEIDAMQTDLQAKLLRVLQDGRVRRVGGTEVREVDVRIIAACGQEPGAAMRAGKLRADLYYRLNVISLGLPALSERRDDIPLLVAHFVERYNRLLGLMVRGVAPEVMALFLAYDWPGNVRELQHTLEGAMNMLDGDTILLEHLPGHLRDWAGNRGDAESGSGGSHTERFAERLTEIFMAPLRPAPAKNTGHEAIRILPEMIRPLPELVEDLEREAISRALEKTGGSVARAARLLGMPRQTLQYKIGKLGLGG